MRKIDHTHILLSLLIMLVASSCGSCSKHRNLPDVDQVPVARYNTGLTFVSKTLGVTVTYDIMLPRDYNDNPGHRYPVVYCFHGYGDDNTSWNGHYMACQAKITNLEDKGLEPMIYVFPNGWKTYWCDRYDGTFPYMTMLAEEMVPLIDLAYRTIADRDHRAVTGYSMGGFGAMVTAMKHPDVFSMSAPLSMSFRTDEQYMTESQSGWDNQWGKVFGGVGQTGEGRLTDYYKSLCPLHQFTAANKDKYNSVHWFLTCGDDEQQLLFANDDLHVLMRENGYPHEYRVANGGHTTSYWKTALEEVLPWFSSLMAGHSEWQTSLREVNVPDDCKFDSEGVVVSDGYTEAGGNCGTGLYIAYDGTSEAWIKDAMAILQRGISSKKFVLLPCNVAVHSLADCVKYYKDIYPTKAYQVLAIGKAGTEAVQKEALFSTLYFESAEILGDINLSSDKNYYLCYSDDGQNYKSANALYKACKSCDATFEYRCRNHMDDPRTDFLTGIEYIKSNLYNF
ncbi:MAG: esterase family protein [Bacteroidales bacterium]|nr:esterase family protein [Bacteroidales bacterium]